MAFLCWFCFFFLLLLLQTRKIYLVSIFPFGVIEFSLNVYTVIHLTNHTEGNVPFWIVLYSHRHTNPWRKEQIRTRRKKSIILFCSRIFALDYEMEMREGVNNKENSRVVTREKSLNNNRMENNANETNAWELREIDSSAQSHH